MSDFFDEGFKAGWKARGEFIQDWNRLSEQFVGGGMAMMLVGGLSFMTMFANAIGMGFNINFKVFGAVIFGSIVFSGAGFFVNRIEKRAYQNRVSEFNKKWKR